MAGGRGWMDAFVETVNLSHFSLGTSEAGDNSVHRKTRFRVEYVFKNVYRDIPSGGLQRISKQVRRFLFVISLKIMHK